MSAGENVKTEKLIVEPSSSLTTSERVVTNLLKSDQRRKAPNITAMPPSSVLDRVKQFLPKLQEANKKLLEVENKSELDIENISQEHKDNFIEINLACADLDDGRLDILKDAASDAADPSDIESESESEGEPNLPSDCRSVKTKSLITEL